MMRMIGPNRHKNQLSPSIPPIQSSKSMIKNYYVVKVSADNFLGRMLISSGKSDFCIRIKLPKSEKY